MPMSALIAASTEQNACTSPLQQLFNNLNNQAQPNTPQRGFHSLFLDSTYLSHLLLLLPYPPTHTQCRRRPIVLTLSEGEGEDCCKVSTTGKIIRPTQFIRKCTISPLRPLQSSCLIYHYSSLPVSVHLFVQLFRVNVSEELNKTAVKPTRGE